MSGRGGTLQSVQLKASARTAPHDLLGPGPLACGETRSGGRSAGGSSRRQRAPAQSGAMPHLRGAGQAPNGGSKERGQNPEGGVSNTAQGSERRHNDYCCCCCKSRTCCTLRSSSEKLAMALVLRPAASLSRCDSLASRSSARRRVLMESCSWRVKGMGKKGRLSATSSGWRQRVRSWGWAPHQRHFVLRRQIQAALPKALFQTANVLCMSGPRAGGSATRQKKRRGWQTRSRGFVGSRLRWLSSALSDWRSASTAPSRSCSAATALGRRKYGVGFGMEREGQGERTRGGGRQCTSLHCCSSREAPAVGSLAKWALAR